MGYDSRLLIAGKTNCSAGDVSFEMYEVIAQIELCSCGNELFHQNSSLFNTPLKNSDVVFGCGVDLDGRDTEESYEADNENVDEYGEICHYTTVDRVIDALKKLLKTEEYYRRYDLALTMLKNISSVKGFKNLVVIHYGH